MSTLTAPPATATAPQAAEPGRLAPVLALARFEARELLLQIPVVAAGALWLFLIVLRLIREDGMDDFPALFMADRATQGLPMILALAVLISVNTEVLRGHRNKTVEQFSMLPLEPWRRTLAHVLSIVPFALFTAVAVGVDFAYSALKPGAVGSGSVAELLVGPLTVMFAGIIGILLAGLWPLSVIPVMLLAVAYFLLIGPAALTGDWSQWFNPVVSEDSSGGFPTPSYLLDRPAGWHALYLAALCVLLACVAMLVKGGRTAVLKAAAVVALAVTVTAGFGQRPGDGTALTQARRIASEHPEKVQSCEEHGGSTYCSFPEWDGQRERWARVVDRVRSVSGSTAPVTVRQRIDVRGGVESNSALDPQTGARQVTIGTRWGGNRVPEFAVGVASVLVAGSERAAENLCGARGVTVMWLALGADPTPKDTFKDVRLDDSNVGSGIVLAPTDPVSLTAQQTEVVNSILDRPATDVTAAVKAHWSELTSQQTTTADAARLLGVAAPKGAEKCDEYR
ncbi:ABC transporter permease [Streptomyces sp. S6]